MICYLLGKPERKEWELFPDINHRVIKLSQIEKVALLQIVGGDKLIIPFC